MTALKLTEIEKAKVEAFGLDKPEETIVEDELSALSTIVAAIKPLDQKTKMRVIYYLRDRFSQEPF